MKIRNIIIAGVCSLAMVSCNYLDFDETSGANSKEDMYVTFQRVQNMLTNVYSYMPQYSGFTFGGAALNNLAMQDCASDDAEFGATSAAVQNVNNGTWSATNTFDDAWNLYYGIRAANSFLVELEDVDLSRYYTNAQYKNWLKRLESYHYEARVLRANYFFELARRYGDIAMPTEVLTVEEANTIGKTPFNEVIAFIVSELDDCAAHLPVTFATAEMDQAIGRTTKGYALALKTKALLYAASPLHNTSNNAELWKEAARAALEVMNLTDDKGAKVYSLDPNGCINKTTSSELILARMNGTANSSFELYNFPLRFTYGTRAAAFVAGGNFPSQNLVDAFETKNGYAVTLGTDGWICSDPDFDPQNPYANRDPRFERTILADGMTFKGETIAVNGNGGADFVSTPLGGSATGYFIRKFINETANFNPEVTGGAATQHHWVIYRYAETLLSYAEAMVNAFGDGSYTDGEFTVSALSALNEVRANANMPAVANASKDELLARIRNEWRVEFAFENHRFWDVRRWKIGAETQTVLNGVYIVRNTDGTKTYRLNTVESRSWSERMYLYPIPQSELFKNTNLYPQNAGW